MKVIYNVTLNIDEEIHLEFIEWLKNIHIPEVLSSKCFFDAKLSKIDGEEQGGKTYSVMYISENREKYDYYQNHFAQSLQNKTIQKFGNKFVAFRTVLDVIEHFTDVK